MYGAKYANNLRKNLLSATDKGLMNSPKKADLKIYKDSDDVTEDILADLVTYMDIKPEVRDEVAAKKAQARQNEMTESTSRALVNDDDEVVTLDEANETKSLVTKPKINPISPLAFDPKKDVDRAVEALRLSETEGEEDPYTAEGKEITDSKSMYFGEKALGAYGVMPTNVPEFTKKYGGKELTVEEFKNNPKMQDKVAKQFFLQNFKKYGNLDDVVSVWFTGDPLDQAINRDASDGFLDIKGYRARYSNFYNELGRQ
tara:strand:+ start:40 stop:813 length:774 start_codon:yes stop_codon:yes gene_type:complete